MPEMTPDCDLCDDPATCVAENGLNLCTDHGAQMLDGGMAVTAVCDAPRLMPNPHGDEHERMAAEELEDSWG